MRRKPREQASAHSRALFFLALLTVIAVALYPNLKLPTKIIGIALSDELFHILAFSTLTFIAVQVWNSSLSLAIKLVLFALGLELAQAAAPGHEVQLSDAVASLSGIALGSIVSSVLSHVRKTVLSWN